MVQNAAARLLTVTKKHDHITLVLASLQWLPVHFTIQFKILLIVFKALNGQAPSYITDLMCLHSATRSWSAYKVLLHVSQSCLKLKHDRAFTVAAPHLWNQLPLDIESAPSISAFKSRLNAHFFCWPSLSINLSIHYVCAFPLLFASYLYTYLLTYYVHICLLKIPQKSSCWIMLLSKSSKIFTVITLFRDRLLQNSLLDYHLRIL